jgi:uncharacterized protein
MKLQEREFFSLPAPVIATATNAAKRRQLVAKLETDDPRLYARYQEALAAADSVLTYCRTSGQYARLVAEEFHPEKIILFGSYAYGTPDDGSDVDLLVVMPAGNEASQAVRIRLALPAPFPMDLLVRTPEKLRRRIDEGNWFLREVMEKGRGSYANRNPALGGQALLPNSPNGLTNGPPRCASSRRFRMKRPRCLSPERL